MLRNPRAPFAQRLLGLFVAWQLCFLVGANLLELFPSRSVGPDQRTEPVLGLLRWPFERWAELSGQWQQWAFFAPSVPRAAAFAGVDLHWPDRVEHLVSSFERFDDDCRFQPVLYAHRLFNYEWKQVQIQVVWEDENLDGTPGAWQGLMSAGLRVHEDAWASYLRWRLHRFQRQNPNVPMPAEVVLVGRTYRTPPPDGLSEEHRPPTVRPMVSYRPGHASLELCDPPPGREVPRGAEP